MKKLIVVGSVAMAAGIFLATKSGGALEFLLPTAVGSIFVAISAFLTFPFGRLWNDKKQTLIQHWIFRLLASWVFLSLYFRYFVHAGGFSQLTTPLRVVALIALLVGAAECAIFKTIQKFTIRFNCANPRGSMEQAMTEWFFSLAFVLIFSGSSYLLSLIAPVEAERLAVIRALYRYWNPTITHLVAVTPGTNLEPEPDFNEPLLIGSIQREDRNGQVIYSFGASALNPEHVATNRFEFTRSIPVANLDQVIRDSQGTSIPVRRDFLVIIEGRKVSPGVILVSKYSQSTYLF